MTELETLVMRVRYAKANYERQLAAAEGVTQQQRQAWQDTQLAAREMNAAEEALLKLVRSGAMSLQLQKPVT